MARQNARGLELSFHKAKNRWYKTIDGKPVYFGSKAKNPDDMHSYWLAMREYEEVQAYPQTLSFWQLHKQFHAAKSLDIKRKLAKGMKAELDDIDVRQAVLRGGRAISLDESNGASWGHMLGVDFDAPLPARASRTATAIVDKDSAVSILVSSYLGSLDRRIKETEKHPEKVTKKKRMSAKHKKCIASDLKTFTAFCTEHGIRKLGGDDKLDTTLMSYRESLVDRMLEDEYTTNTVNNKLKNLSTFIKWAFQESHIKNMPRRADDIFAKYKYVPEPKPFSDEILKKLWGKIDESKYRCWFILGLNCAFYGMDIGNLQKENIKKIGGSYYYCGYRGKTKVPAKIKLWPETYRLLKPFLGKAKQGEYVFTTRWGNHLQRNDSVGQAFRKVQFDSGVQGFKFSSLRDTILEAVELIGKASGNLDLAPSLAAHKDNRTLRFYVDIKPADLPTDELDAALDQLWAKYSKVLTIGK